MQLKRFLRDYYLLIIIPLVIVAFVCAVASVKPQVKKYCVLEDSSEDYIEIEVSAEEVWEQIVDMYNSGERKWVGGKLASSDNQWGFTFEPETVIVADSTAENLQTTFEQIKADPDYWFDIDICYINATAIGVRETT